MRWIDVLALGAVGVSAVATGCYRSHVRDVDARDSGADVASARDAGPDDAGRLCGCPDDPRAEVCALPEMCCPVTGTCENPARFLCSGSIRTCP